MAEDGRKALYKLGSPGNVTTWKQRYREQCQQRLRDNRAKQYERLRQMEHLPSEQDTKQMASAAVTDAMEVARCSLTGEELPLQEVDELTEELIAEEQSLLAQYLDDLKFSEQVASAAIESSQSVWCPICQQLGHHYCRITTSSSVSVDYVLILSN
ncbi:RPA-interacting protein B-like isoform X3 [Dysidea avara]|uniref:RPA-interacting protein B-like isoform X3 n=1 Tax=Dysidea avara TaxID=196820 RepID=UPI0033218387